MSHETPTIKAEVRDRTGTRYARRLRAAGRLPAVIYGHQQAPVHVSVDEKEVISHLKHGLHVVELHVEGESPETCLVKDLQYGYLGDNVVHVDFARVNLQEEVEVNVHLVFVGTAPEMHHANAIFNQEHPELLIRCKVRDIPEDIKVDVSRMEGMTLMAGQIPLPAGLELADDPNKLVASIEFARQVAAVGEEAEVAAEGEAEPEVISEGGDEAEGEGEAAESASESSE
jgi:large subunit ribosomal protein L25